ncbi:HET-domain-containing protein, partial [Zopfia rhizophila CBS 207.26]
LPTRLIFLHEENGECFPRLVYTVEIASTHFEYTTLSHRSPFRRRKKPKKTHSEGVTLHYLPRTFRDAIRISLAIGVPYIWIDSLCIVQDDEEDWRREAARMGDIYEGSYLNIAALDSPNCNGGCALYRRKPATHVRLQNGSQLAIRALAAHPADVFDSHLNTRGWIFQELVLPIRVLYCGKNQFYWQCSTKVYSEDGFIDHDMALNLPGTRTLNCPTSLQTNSPNPWWVWIQDFSKRNFTQSPDRLPALIGVTRKYQETTGLTPVLGLWKETLLDDLAW